MSDTRIGGKAEQSRSTPDRVIASAKALKLFKGLSGSVLVAVSGGPDSMALLGLLVENRTTLGIVIHAATVDHQLRPASGDEAQQVAAFCNSHDVPHAILEWSDAKPIAGLQEAARNARYELLCAHALHIGARMLLTGHTADDQAETVLMRIAAGTGIAGLGGMRRRTKRGNVALIRPCLAVPKSSMIATCLERGWPFSLDPTNADMRFTRPQLRAASHALEAVGLSPERLVQLAKRAAEAEDSLMHAAWLLFAACRNADGSLNGHHVFASPLAIARRAFLMGLEEAAKQAGIAAVPMRLERLERATDALVDAIGAKKGLTLSLMGMIVTLHKDGSIQFVPEPVRKRGRSSSDVARIGQR
jgi:tRNA(Ile)-lysidine synthase